MDRTLTDGFGQACPSRTHLVGNCCVWLTIKHWILFLFVLGWSSSVSAQYDQLSAEAEVHLLTVDPGPELYSSFGHSAFRLIDPGRNYDHIYNYGTFSFNTPGFYMKFARGKLPYYLAGESVWDFVYLYESEGRNVKAQVLNLEQSEVQQIYEYLENNLKPENREYQYDFFFDNCATREKKVIEQVFGENVDWRPWPADSLGSLRELIDIYLAKQPWPDFGIDLVLGLPADQQADMHLSTFLPDFLHDAFDRAVIRDGENWKPLVKREYWLVKPGRPFVAEDSWFTPSVAMWGFFAIVLLLTSLLSADSLPLRIFDLLFFLTIGLLSVLILLLWFATDHDATQNNLNILWAHPLYLYLAGLRLFGSRTRQFNGARWDLFCLALFGLVSIFLPQGFHPALLPLLLAIVLRLLHMLGEYQNE